MMGQIEDQTVVYGGQAQAEEAKLPAPDELRDIAVVVALKAAALIRKERAGVGDLKRVTTTKSSDVDPVTEVDKHSEEFITNSIRALRPADGFLGEEGARSTSQSGVTWVIDPIDGTVNFIYGIPQYAVSIAAAINEDIVAGAVINVVTGEVYRSARGEGAQKAVVPPGETVRHEAFAQISASSATEIEQSLLATGFAYLASRRMKQAEILTKLLPTVRDIRRMGSAALDLCALGEGRVDCYFEHGIHPWDYAAGQIIAEEAGASVHSPGISVPGREGLPVWGAAPGVGDAFERLLASAGALGAIPD